MFLKCFHSVIASYSCLLSIARFCDTKRIHQRFGENKLLHHKVDALLIGVLRGGGAYVCNSVLEFDNERDIDWKTGEEALVEIRSDKCACIDDVTFVNGEFRNDQNSKRRRILNHLEGGSFDLKDIKV